MTLFLWRQDQISTYSRHRFNHRPKYRLAPKSSLVNQCVLLRLLTRVKLAWRRLSSPKPTPEWVTDYESSRSGAHWSIRRQLIRWESVLQGSSVRENLFQVTKLYTHFQSWLGSCLLLLSSLDNLFLPGGLAGMSFFQIGQLVFQ